MGAASGSSIAVRLTLRMVIRNYPLTSTRTLALATNLPLSIFGSIAGPLRGSLQPLGVQSADLPAVFRLAPGQCHAAFRPRARHRVLVAYDTAGQTFALDSIGR